MFVHHSESFKSYANQLHLECKAHSPKYISSSSIKWYKNSIPLHTLSNGKYLIENQNGRIRLSISNPNETDSGEYRCEIEMPGQPAQSMSHTVTVEPPKAPPVPEEGHKRRLYHHQHHENEREHSTQKPINGKEHVAPIALASFMKNLTIEAGGRAKFVCSLVGNDDFAVVWFKNNILLQPELDRRYRVITTDAIVGLEILGVKKEDSGYYTCTIKGQRNSVTSSSQLTVYEAYSPKLRKNESFTHDRPPMSLPLSEFIGKGKVHTLTDRKENRHTHTFCHSNVSHDDVSRAWDSVYLIFYLICFYRFVSTVIKCKSSDTTRTRDCVQRQ